ncbi:GHKL domain-containing protein [Kineothrix alysoides]|uniref:GHKL domain-containing protein n=1 Tax=Kineothrix alysoides TaxID=1469948 RepID=A0A4V2QB44_9FIRM|nr:sensor histidine kinase [Kineothrix alysoides]TCL54992.1 GHKL domain-containing protein [Kineothrix alysoides]
MSTPFPFLPDLLLPVLHLLIMQRCMKAFFGPLHKSLPGYAGWFLYYVFQVFSGPGSALPSHLMLACNILLVFLTASLSGCGSLKRRCAFSVLVCTVWMLVEIIVLILLELFGMGGESLQMAGSFISKMAVFILAVTAGRCLPGRNRRDVSVRYFFAILVIPICSIYLMHYIFLIAYIHREYSFFAVSAGILLLLVSYVIFEVYDWMARDAELREQNRLYEQQLELCGRQAQEQESLYLELRRMRHDMKNHLSGILGMVQAGDAEDAALYLQGLLDDGIAGQPAEAFRSGNIVVDSLVNHKCALARREGIAFEADVFLPAGLPFQGSHLVIILGNLLENALEACRKLEPGKGYIHLDASYVKGVLQVTVRNPYEGSGRRDAEGRFLSTKPDAHCHGLGLLSVEQAAACYRGQMKISDQGGMFQVTVVMYGSLGEK